jgi:phage tail sheath protein FI
VIALHPHLAAGRHLDLQEGAVNLVRRESRGFMNMSESTLSPEAETRPIHVRRLLMLLRRLVLRRGALYVFEPNSPAFRRQVQSGFEEILADLYTRGAFGGTTPAAAYRVDVGDRLNPPASVEQGRLVVEIRVAPSQALLFLTIRLVMTGARSLQVQEG